MYEYSWDGTLNKPKYLLQINGWILERNIENGKSQQIICCSRIYNLWEIIETQQVTSKNIDKEEQRDLQSNINL